MNQIINRIKKETNNQDNIIYRKKKILHKNIYIIFNETLSASDKISSFIIRSLNHIHIPTYNNIINKISNFKYKEITTYEEIVYYLNSGFTILLISNNKYIALETKKDLSRGVSTPVTENTSRGALDAFTENIENNIGLLKRRIKSNDLWIKNYKLGKYTKTSTCLIYIKSIASEELVNKVDKLIKNIDIDGIIASGTIRNLIEKENQAGKKFDVPPKIMAEFYSGAVTAIIMWWLKTNSKISEQDLCNYIVSLIFDGQK